MKQRRYKAGKCDTSTPYGWNRKTQKPKRRYCTIKGARQCHLCGASHCQNHMHGYSSDHPTCGSCGRGGLQGDKKTR